MKYNIWSYWENKGGTTRPEYLDLCEQTWHRHCGADFVIRCLTPETVAEFAPDLIDEWHRLPVLAHKADYLRAVLTYEHGGIWLDNDTIVLRNMSEMMETLDRSGSDFIGCGRPGRRPSNGVFGAKAGCPLLGEYIQGMNRLMRARSSDLKFSWTELGYNLLWPLTRDYDFFQYEFRICIPVHPSRFRVFFESRPLHELSPEDCDIRDDTLTVYLYNAMFPVAFKRLSQEAVLQDDMVISQIYRQALGVGDTRG